MNNETLEQHIHLIYETVNDPSSWPICLEEIAKTIEATSGKIGVNKLIGKVDANTLYEEKLGLKSSGIVNTSESVGFHQHMSHKIDAYIGQSSDNLVRISFSRSKKKESYNEFHTSYLNRLLPHIKHALSLCKKVLEHNTETELCQKILDSTHSIIFIIDSDFNMIKKSAEADKFLSEEVIVKISNNKINCISGLTKNDFSSAIKLVTEKINYFGQSPYFPFLIPRNSDNGFWLFEISRFESTIDPAFSNLLNVDASIFAMITIRDLLHTADSITNRLKLLFSLSDSETEISLFLAKGMTPKEIADKRYRSIETIRTQIKKICIKVGVKNTNSLIAHINHLKD